MAMHREPRISLRFLPFIALGVVVFLGSQWTFVADLLPRNKILRLPGRSIAAETRMCASPIAKHFSPSALQAAAERNWDHVINVHTKLATILDSGAFGRNNSYVPFDLLPPVGPPCASGLAEIGSAAWGSDNNKMICGVSSLQEDGCVVYSVGGHGEWGFEEGIVRDTRCTVHTFDCTEDYPVPAHLQSRVTFHKVCLSSKASTSDGKAYLPWEALVALAGGATPAHVKMDIEGWEYAALTAIMEGPSELLPWQLSLEVHWYTGGVGGPYWGNSPLPLLMRNGHHFDVGPSFLPPHDSYMPPGAAPPKYSYKTPGELAAFGNLLFLKGGYMVVSREDNPWCRHCTEIVLARLLCAA